jgi:AraC-like DNA-binding protein
MAKDVLEELLTTLDVRVHAFAMCEVQDGHRLVFEPAEAVIVHYVLAGVGVLYVDGAAPAAFGPGHILIVPPGRGQALAGSGGLGEKADASEHCRMLADGMLKFEAFEDRGDLITVCATITATYSGGFGMFDHLPAPLVEDIAGLPLLKSALEQMLQEMQAPGMGTRALVEALMKQSLLLLLRDHLARFGTQSPLFFTLREPRLVRAIAAVLAMPGAAHTLASLAAEAGMSRSVFAKRFSEAYGQSPFEFVQKVRLRHGAHLLAVTDLPVKLIARSVGYSSRSHFSRAFRAAFKKDPSSYRKMRAEADALIGPIAPPPLDA